MATRTITFTPQGIVEALHYDDMDLGFLGKKKIGRASEIKFDEEAQSFYIVIPGLEGEWSNLTGFKGYDEAREFEVMFLESCKLNQLNPATADTKEIGILMLTCRAMFIKGIRKPVDK